MRMLFALLRHPYRQAARVLFITSLLMSSLISVAKESTEPPPEHSLSFETSVAAIAAASLSTLPYAVEQLLSVDDKRVFPIIEALAQGQLWANKSTQQLAIKSNNHFLLATSQIVVDNSGYKRVAINNSLRVKLRTALAQSNLNHSNANIRLKAVERMIGDGVDETIITLLQTRQSIETDDRVRNAITTAQALFTLQRDDVDSRLSAITLLSSSLLPEVRSTLEDIAANDPNAAVKRHAEYTLEAINTRVSTYRMMETIFFGLSLGSVLLLAAIGLAITFGVMGVINMAHGELMMIGAYVTWCVQQLFPHHINYSLAIAIPAAFLIAGLIGVAIERGVIRFLYGRPLETLLATFGISLILQQAARSVFSPLNRAVELPTWMSGSWEINPALSITYSRLYIFLFGLFVFFAILAVLKKTSLGLKVRAVSQNRAMARAVGVRASWVDAMTFGLGSGIAGVAGVALSQLTNVGPNLGQAYIIDSFMVVVFGGVGNLWGTLVGAMGLGVLNKFLEPYAGAVLAKVIVLVVLILFIQKRPKGLFPQKGRAASE